MLRSSLTIYKSYTFCFLSGLPYWFWTYLEAEITEEDGQLYIHLKNNQRIYIIGNFWLSPASRTAIPWIKLQMQDCEPLLLDSQLCQGCCFQGLSRVPSFRQLARFCVAVPPGLWPSSTALNLGVTLPPPCLLPNTGEHWQFQPLWAIEEWNSKEREADLWSRGISPASQPTVSFLLAGLSIKIIGYFPCVQRQIFLPTITPQIQQPTNKTPCRVLISKLHLSTSILKCLVLQ